MVFCMAQGLMFKYWPGLIIFQRIWAVSKMIFSSLVFETNSKNNQFNVIALGIKIYRQHQTWIKLYIGVIIK